MILKGLGNSDNEIASFQYADDTAIFSVLDLDKLRNLKLPCLFENASGMNINYQKTKAIWMGGTELQKDFIAMVLIAKLAISLQIILVFLLKLES